MRRHDSPEHALDHRPSSRHAAAELGSALREAGIRVPLARHCAEPQPGRVELGPLSPGEASQLARLVRTGAKRTLKAARALRDIVDAYRLDLPGIQVRDGHIALGSTSPATAERLARLLGCPVRGKVPRPRLVRDGRDALGRRLPGPGDSVPQCRQGTVLPP
ncbi:hypothetical protein ACIOHO_20345 [Streptomyces sp. NPDC087849]|uniref:hypothetical protein n=1 Tax=Streptomyces sp. NPDC087849 TaxID=3365808 RepID=UPI0037F1CCD0